MLGVKLECLPQTEGFLGKEKSKTDLRKEVKYRYKCSSSPQHLEQELNAPGGLHKLVKELQ